MKGFFRFIFASSSEAITGKDLRHYRLLLLIGIITHPLIGIIRNLSDVGVHDPMSIRLVITATGAAVYALSFRSGRIRENFINLVYILGYLVSIHIVYVLLLNHFSVNYVIGYFLILVAVGIIFNDTWNLRSYLIFMHVAAIIASCIVESPPIQLSVFLSAALTMSLVIYFALRSKILANKELDKINHLLLLEVEERKTAEEEVQQLNKELKEHVGELKSINNDLEAFSYSAAHDLRAPLRIINQYSFLLRDKYNSLLDEEGLSLLDVVIRNTNDMDKLITDLIDFARLGKKEVRKEKLNTAELVESILCNHFQKEITGKVSIETSNLPEVKADFVLLQQVFINLISNALKYSAPKESIRIEISSYVEKDEAVFFVKDNGGGFDMKYVHKLFHIFQRLHHKDEFEGTGLGLAIVKRIIEKHKGRVWAESAVNEGASFYFTIPLS